MSHFSAGADVYRKDFGDGNFLLCFVVDIYSTFVPGKQKQNVLLKRKNRFSRPT